MGDELVGKYQKLATAYAELKQKNAVLKAAVQDLTQKQQQGGSQGAPGMGADGAGSIKVSQLQKKLKEADQALRKQAQDMDALRFHNQQLTRRVEVLQEEENRRSAEKGKKKKTSAEVEALHLQEEELRRKIRENEQLHRKVVDMKRESDREIRQLREQLQMAERSVQSGDESRRSLAEQAQRVRDDVQRESAGLIERIGKLEVELKSVRESGRAREAELEQRLQRSDAEMARLRRLSSAQRNKSGFDDIAHAAFNELNVPMVDRAQKHGVDEVKRKAQQHIKQYANGFSNLLSYFEQTVPSGDAWGGKGRATDEYKHVLEGHAKRLKPLDHAFAAFADGATALAPFADAFFAFSRYLGEFSQAFSRFVQQQVASPDCSQRLREANLAASEGFRNIAAQLDRLAGLCNVIAKEAGSGGLQQSIYSITGYLNDLVHEHRGLKEAGAAKAAEEERIGWVDTSTGAVIVATLGSLEQATGELGRVLNEGQAALVGGGQNSVRGAPMQSLDTCRKPGLLQHLTSRATGYMSTLSCDPPDSVPYSDALALRDGRMPGAGVNGGGGGGPDRHGSLGGGSDAMLRTCQERIAELEREREHTALEFQLLQMKLKSASGNDSDGDGSGAGPDFSGGGSEVEILRRHYEDRIKLLTEQLRVADGKAVTYYDECRAIAHRLEYMRNSQAKQGEEYKNVNGTIARLKEDLESTKRNYEEQLAAMTEHIMEMNDKLQKQDAASAAASKGRGGKASLAKTMAPRLGSIGRKKDAMAGQPIHEEDPYQTPKHYTNP